MLNACSKEAPRVRNLTNLITNLHFLFTGKLPMAIYVTRTRTSPFTLQPFTYLRARPRCAALQSYHLGSRICRATSVSVAHSRHTPTNPERCPIAEHCTTSPCGVREAAATMLTRAAATAVGAARVRRPIARALRWAHGRAPRGGARQAAASGDIEARRMLTEAMEREDEARVPALLHVSEVR